MPIQSDAPAVTGIRVHVATYTGDTIGAYKPIGHLDGIGNLIDSSRAVTKYTPMNDQDYDEIVELESESEAAFSFDVLYDPEGTEGINDLRTAYKANTKVSIKIELNNSGGTNGTTYVQDGKASSFQVGLEKGGKAKASISIEKDGDAVITPAA